MSTDPFRSAQSDILALLAQSRPLLHSYLRIRSSAPSPTSPELTEARLELNTTLTDLSADLQDLVASVRAVEGDPHRYGLDHAEVGRRRALVADVGREVEDMRTRLSETVEQADLQQQRLAHPDHFSADDEDPLAGQTDDADDYGQWEEQRQREMMHEQDDALDGVFQTVGTLRAQADTMGRELEEQAEMLEGVEEVADRVGGKLAVGVKKIRVVLERGEATHPLLTQTPLTLNPFLDLPKPPTLPPTYTTLPSTLPPTRLNAPPTPSDPHSPAYITSADGTFAAHPRAVVAQTEALLAAIGEREGQARREVEAWERGVGERVAAERRRRAPGWLDSGVVLLRPETVGDRREEGGGGHMGGVEGGEGEGRGGDLLGEEVVEEGRGTQGGEKGELGGKGKETETEGVGGELGDAMDRVFGPSEMG
ncbi:hypothetical protein LTR08_007138 [Meristemomyces frigidus]|nr:hypothetical protein LTR08_007138 [Meristemomyces frigidus]